MQKGMLRVVSGLLGAEIGKNWEKSWDQKRLGFCVIAAVVFLPLATYSISYVSQARFGGLPNLPSSALGLADPLDRFHPISFPGGQLAHWCDDVPRRSSRRPMGRSKANRRVLSILSRTAWRPPSNTYTCTDAQYTDTLRMYTVYVYDI
jgi:hypothetical protein